MKATIELLVDCVGRSRWSEEKERKVTTYSKRKTNEKKGKCFISKDNLGAPLEILGEFF